MRPCGSCVRAEFADDDSDGIQYIASKPDAKIAHIERPRGSWGTGSALAVAIRSSRGRQTYCGWPIGESWTKVEP